MEAAWERFKKTLQTTCEEELGHQKKKYKSWLSEEIIKEIEEKRRVRQRLLQAKTRAQKQVIQTEYTAKQKEIKRSCRKDKTDCMDQMAIEAQEAAKRGDMRILYGISKKLTGRAYLNPNKPIKAFDGAIITKTSEQLDRWKQHFKTLLCGGPVDDPPDVRQRQELGVNLGPIRREEVIGAISKLKAHKAPGNDDNHQKY